MIDRKNIASQLRALRLAELGMGLSPLQRIVAGIRCAASTANQEFTYFRQGTEEETALPVKAAVHIYEGDAVSKSVAATAGYARQLNSATPDVDFLGFALAEADNSVGAAADGSITVLLRTHGFLKLTVAAGGVLANTIADVGLAVYATDSQTFTGSSAANALKIGYIRRWISSGVYEVEFWGTPSRSVAGA